MYISAFGPLPALLILLSYCLSIQPFLTVFGGQILFPNRSVSLGSDFYVITSHLFVEFYFFFLISCFVYIILPLTDISSVFLLSPVLSGLSPYGVLLLLLFQEYFSFQSSLIVSLWILSDSKSPHISKTLLGILADRSHAVAWMVKRLKDIEIRIQVEIIQAIASYRLTGILRRILEMYGYLRSIKLQSSPLANVAVKILK